MCRTVRFCYGLKVVALCVHYYDDTAASFLRCGTRQSGQLGWLCDPERRACCLINSLARHFVQDGAGVGVLSRTWRARVEHVCQNL